jgi:hypothetical protein
MMTTVESKIAAKLLKIAEQVKVWEDRDVREQKEAGKRLSRPAFFADLQEIAAMLEGAHPHTKLKGGKPNRGSRRRSHRHVQRDLEICEIIHRHVDGGEGIEKCKDLAAAEKCVSKKTADAAWQRYKHARDHPLGTYFFYLEADGLATTSRDS